MPAVAVCLAAWNGVRWLPEQVDSIFDQQGVKVTLFASVDVSSDGTEAWFDARSQADSRIVVLPHGQCFGGAAKNFFRLLREVDFSGFDYVSLADQDDIWHPDKLARAVATLQTQQCDGYSSDVLAFWESGQSRYIKKSWPQRRWDYFFESSGPGCTFVLSRTLATDVQGFLRQHEPETANIALHDWFIYAYARAHGYVWRMDERAGLRYRQHEGNQVGVNEGWRAFARRAKYILDGDGMAQADMIAALIGAADQPFVRRWRGGGRMGLLWLAWQAGECRRRPRDRVWFALGCAALALSGGRA